jgi:stearoyl-CoA desaturase (delta-9 desaturase)
MNLSYVDIVSIKVVFFTILAIFAIPYYFYSGGTLIEFIIVRLIARFFGIFNGIGSHRWLCHNSFKPTLTGKYLMLIGILFGGYGKPLHVVIAHRAHHAHSDQTHDPHSPLHLTFLQMWLGRFKTLSNTRIPRDFFRDKQVVFLNNHYWKIFWIFNIVLALVDLKTALIFCPITFAYGWMLNTIVNYFGHNGNVGSPRNLNTTLVWLTFGEGLHKNHHDAPNNYTFGDTTNIDPAKYFIDAIKIK